MSKIPSNVVEFPNQNYNKSDNSGNGGGGDMDIAKRVDKLETKTDKLQESLNRIEITLARIEGDLKTKASAVELAEVKGQLKNMPSTWQLVVTILSCMLGVAGFVFAIVKYVK
jgi:hypothetical protein